MCKVGQRCAAASSQGCYSRDVYEARKNNRTYRRDLANKVRESGNPDLAKRIMKAKFVAMPELTRAAGLDPVTVSGASLPGTIKTHSISAEDRDLIASVQAVTDEARASVSDDFRLIHPDDDITGRSPESYASMIYRIEREMEKAQAEANDPSTSPERADELRNQIAMHRQDRDRLSIVRAREDAYLDHEWDADREKAYREEMDRIKAAAEAEAEAEDTPDTTDEGTDTAIDKPTEQLQNLKKLVDRGKKSPRLRSGLVSEGYRARHGLVKDLSGERQYADDDARSSGSVNDEVYHLAKSDAFAAIMREVETADFDNAAGRDALRKSLVSDLAKAERMNKGDDTPYEQGREEALRTALTTVDQAIGEVAEKQVVDKLRSSAEFSGDVASRSVGSQDAEIHTAKSDELKNLYETIEGFSFKDPDSRDMLRMTLAAEVATHEADSQGSEDPKVIGALIASREALRAMDELAGTSAKTPETKDLIGNPEHLLRHADGLGSVPSDDLDRTWQSYEGMTSLEASRARAILLSEAETRASAETSRKMTDTQLVDAASSGAVDGQPITTGARRAVLSEISERGLDSAVESSLSVADRNFLAHVGASASRSGKGTPAWRRAKRDPEFRRTMAADLASTPDLLEAADNTALNAWHQIFSEDDPIENNARKKIENEMAAREREADERARGRMFGST